MKNVKMHCLNPFQSSIVDFTDDSRWNNVIFSLFANVSEQQKIYTPFRKTTVNVIIKGVIWRVAVFTNTLSIKYFV